MFLDLDGFKPVNDTFGHPKGDAVLKSVAQRLVKEVGDAGHVGRMGGDEFAIVIKDAQGRKTVENLARALIESSPRPTISTRSRSASASRSAAPSARSTARASTISSRRPTGALPGQEPGPRHLLLLQRRHANVAEHRMRLEQDLRTRSPTASSACSTSR
jgi:predicted signal transduction protein with EAL and GGDEF domain